LLAVTRSTLLRLVALVALVPPLVACSDRPSAAPPPTTAATAPAPGAGRPSVTYGIEATPDGLPVVAVTESAVTVDGTPLGEGELATIKKGKRSDGLVRALEQWRKTHAGDAGRDAGREERAAFDFDRALTWDVIAAVAAAAGQAGYGRAVLLTRHPRGGDVVPSYLELAVRAPGHPKSADRELHVSLSSRGAVMLRWLEGSKQVGDVVSGDAAVLRLAPLVEHGWNERGLHRDANDARRDRAILHVEKDAPYDLVIAAVDALHAPKRKLGASDVPALEVTVE
jgi:hypothetical protein